MDDQIERTPPGWLEILAESEAELAAGQTVSSEIARKGLRDAIDRLEAKDNLKRQLGAHRRS